MIEWYIWMALILSNLSLDLAIIIPTLLMYIDIKAYYNEIIL